MIQLSQTSNYYLIPTGRTTFCIYKAMYNQRDQVVIVWMATKEGLSHVERFYFRFKDGRFNQPGLNAFTAFARAVMGDNALENVDAEALVGKFVSANVIHKKKPNKNDPTRTVTLVSLKSFAKANNFDA